LITGQRVLDLLFPLLKGGVAIIPGGFGTGKTVLEQCIAKFADVNVVVYVGCGERGNEMAGLLDEFAAITDPRNGRPRMERTIVVANTSNMPVAAREASVYTGITMAEYFRDMGYEVVLQADSTSRWAEAMREISGRLEEMPGEEGFPAYLGTRLAAFYERAGKVDCIGGELPSGVSSLSSGKGRPAAASSASVLAPRTGSVSVVGSVSPPGGDLSEPVVQNTLRVVKVYWALQDTLAYERHFPAIDWLTSYSLYLNKVRPYWDADVSARYRSRRDQCMAILQRESELAEIVRLVGLEALSAEEQILMETAKSIREDFLQQNAFRDDDQFSSLKEQDRLLETILLFHEKAIEAHGAVAPLSGIFSAPVRERIARAKYLTIDDIGVYDEIASDIETQLVSEDGKVA
jgi:V/A-type H+-transporting ATPase subunit A